VHGIVQWPAIARAKIAPLIAQVRGLRLLICIVLSTDGDQAHESYPIF
jgi:hypothetical protein